jgi:flagellar M-ring protein FliF
MNWKKTIETLNGVEYARVHIVMPEHSLFVDDKKIRRLRLPLKQLRRQDGRRSGQGIAHLLAYSVEGLAIEKVTIVDTTANVLSDILGNSNMPSKLTANQLQVQQSVETAFKKSVQSMLDKVFGTANRV